MGPSNSQDVEKKISFLGSQRAGDTAVPGLESLAQDVDTVKYDIGELKETHARVARCCLEWVVPSNLLPCFCLVTVRISSRAV